MTSLPPPPFDLVATLKSLQPVERHAAKQEALQALQRWAGTASPHDSAAAHQDIALQFYTLGLFDDCVRQARQAVEAWLALDESGPMCQAMCLKALALSDLGQDDEAVGCAADAFTLARRQAHAPPFVQALTVLGSLHGRLDEFEPGEQLLMQALERARAQRDRCAVVRAHIALISLLMSAHESQSDAGEAELARLTRARLLVQTRETLFLCADESDAFHRVLMRSNAAGGLMAAGFVDDAVDLLRQSVQQARVEGFRIVELKSRCRLARCLSRLGRLDAARRELDSILRALDTDDISRVRTEAQGLLAQVCADAGDAAAAETWREQAVLGRQRQAFGVARARRRLEPARRTVHEALALDVGPLPR